MTSASKMPKAENFFEDPQTLAVAKAISAGDSVALELQLEQVNINQPHVRGMTYLNWAFANNQYEAAKVLLTHNADPYLETDEISPLTLAMKMDDIRWLKLLVETGVDINKKKHGTPLWFETYLAGNWGHLEYLLNHGLDVNATDGVGNTALMDLARLDHYGVVIKLLEHGVNASHQSASGATLASIVQNHIPPPNSQEYQNRKKVIELLEERGIDTSKSQ
jgi:ankyrin repeat protein